MRKNRGTDDAQSIHTDDAGLVIDYGQKENQKNRVTAVAPNNDVIVQNLVAKVDTPTFSVLVTGNLVVNIFDQNKSSGRLKVTFRNLDTALRYLNNRYPDIAMSKKDYLDLRKIRLGAEVRGDGSLFYEIVLDGRGGIWSNGRYKKLRNWRNLFKL